MSQRTPTWLRSSIQASPWGSDKELVKLREGLVLKWYKDTLGKVTGGYGHLQKPTETKLEVTQELADKWLDSDLTAARKAAKSQFSQLPIQTQELYDVLVSVNFQLGPKWYLEHKKTWEHMLAGHYFEAAEEAENSTWYRQTPVRVLDLQKALRKAHELYTYYPKD